MRTDFKVYRRKIHLWRWDENEKIWLYAWSSNAYKTCKDAVAGANRIISATKFSASFAKD